MKYVNYLGVAGIAAGAFLVLSLASSGLEGKGRTFEQKRRDRFVSG